MAADEHPNTLSEPVSDWDHEQGPEEAPIAIVEYADFQCEDSGEFYPIIKQLREMYPIQLKFVYRHYPLRSIHEFAERAAQAADAAGAQGKFWEMHDKLFENQTALTEKDLERYARELGLDMDRYKSDMESSRWAPRVQRDVIGAKKSSVNRTPTIFINGQKPSIPYTAEEFARTVEHHIQEMAFH